MSRALIQVVVLLLIPFVLFGLYQLFRKREMKEMLQKGPFFALTSVGLVLVLISFLIWGLTAGAPPGSVYIPAYYENGVLVPGRFESAD